MTDHVLVAGAWGSDVSPNLAHLPDQRRLGGTTCDDLSAMRLKIDALLSRQIARHGRLQALKGFRIHARLRKESEKQHRYAAPRKAFRRRSTPM